MERLDNVTDKLIADGVDPKSVLVAVGPNEFVAMLFLSRRGTCEVCGQIDTKAEIEECKAGKYSYNGYTLYYRDRHGEPDVKASVV